MHFSLIRDHLHKQVPVWFGCRLAIFLAVASAQIIYEIWIGAEKAAAHETLMALNSCWDNCFRVYGNFKLNVLVTTGMFFSLLHFKSLGKHPATLPLVLALIRLNLVLTTLGLIESKGDVSNQAGLLAIFFDALMFVVLPSAGLPLVWQSHLLTRILLEALQAIYYLRFVKMDATYTAAVIGTRLIISATLAIISDFHSRLQFLKSEASKREAIDAAAALANEERPLIEPEVSIQSRTSFGSASASDIRSPSVRAEQLAPYSQGETVTRVVLKTSHTDDDAALPYFDKAEVHTRFISESFSSYSMSLVSVSVRRGCFIVEMDLVVSDTGRDSFQMDCLKVLESLRISKNLREGSKVSLRMNVEAGQVFQLSSVGWVRMPFSLPSVSFSPNSLALNPQALAFEHKTVVFLGKWTGPKLNDGSSLEVVFCGKPVPTTCTPPCSDWNPGEEIKLVVGLETADWVKTHSSLKFNVWSKPTVAVGPSASAGIVEDLPAFIISTFTTLVLPPGADGAAAELDRVLTFGKLQGLVGDLCILLDSDLCGQPAYFNIAKNMSEWAILAKCPALSSLVSRMALSQRSTPSKGSSLARVGARVLSILDHDEGQVSISWPVAAAALNFVRLMAKLRQNSFTDEAFLLDVWTVNSMGWPYYLFICFHLVLKTYRSDGTAFKLMRAFQRQAGLIMQLNRIALMIGAMLGMPHNIYSLSAGNSCPVKFNARNLAFKATVTALEPFSLRANLIQGLLVEYPTCFLYARARGMTLFHSVVHLTIRLALTVVVVCFRRRVLSKNCRKGSKME